MPVVGKEDKREITVLLSVTASGHLLPPQVIYQGKTVGCHAKITFPDDWHITHSESHWSNEATMLQFIDNIIVPYISAMRRDFELADDHVALAIFDVFTAQRCDSVLKKLRENHIRQVFVPAACTGELQPLDLSTNSDFKQIMKDSFTRWYANEVKQALDNREAIQVIKIDMRASVIKPPHANWLINAITILKNKHAVLTKGFEASGISEYI